MTTACPVRAPCCAVDLPFAIAPRVVPEGQSLTCIVVRDVGADGGPAQVDLLDVEETRSLPLFAPTLFDSRAAVESTADAPPAFDVARITGVETAVTGGHRTTRTVKGGACPAGTSRRDRCVSLYLRSGVLVVHLCHTAVAVFVVHRAQLPTMVRFCYRQLLELRSIRLSRVHGGVEDRVLVDVWISHLSSISGTTSPSRSAIKASKRRRSRFIA